MNKTPEYAYCTKHSLHHGQRYPSCRVDLDKQSWLHRVATGKTTLDEELEAHHLQEDDQL